MRYISNVETAKAKLTFLLSRTYDSYKYSRLRSIGVIIIILY